MDVISFSDAVAFADVVRPVIDRHPAQSSILATLLDQAVAGSPIDDALWLLIIHGGEPVAAGMHTPPYNLFLTPVPDRARLEAAGVLAQALADLGRDLPGVTAATADAHAFAEAWQYRVDCNPRPALNERLYELPDPSALPSRVNASGTARIATERDVNLIASWLTSFNLEAVPDREAVDAEQAVRRRLARGWFLLWYNDRPRDGDDPQHDDNPQLNDSLQLNDSPQLSDSEPVSLAGLSLASEVARVGPVYTPGEHRRHGYASAVTTAATRLGFEQGARRCVLYADLANETANGIYQAIGYRPIGDALMIHFR